MTDKDIIRKEVERRLNELHPDFMCYDYDAAKAEMLEELLSFIDSKQDSNVKPKFKIGQRIRNDKFGAEDVITGIEDDHYKFSNGCCLFFLFQDNWDLVEEKPKAKFKVGDYIKYKWPEEGDEWNQGRIVAIEEDKYLFDEGFVYIKYQDHWELVEEPKKCMYSKDNYTDKDRKVLCEDCEEDCEYNRKENLVSNGCIYNRTLEERQRSCRFCSAACQARIKEEPINEELEEAMQFNAPDNIGIDDLLYWRNGFITGVKWQKEQVMAKAIDAQCFGFQGDALFSFRLPADNYLVGSKVKVIVIKED